MGKSMTVLLVVILMALLLVYPAAASHGEPLGSCPEGFDIHHMMEHSGDHMHQHIGVDGDFNGDGYLCMKMLPNDLHLHVDNFLPLW